MQHTPVAIYVASVSPLATKARDTKTPDFLETTDLLQALGFLRQCQEIGVACKPPLAIGFFAQKCERVS